MSPRENEEYGEYDRGWGDGYAARKLLPPGTPKPMPPAEVAAGETDRLIADLTEAINLAARHIRMNARGFRAAARLCREAVGVDAFETPAANCDAQAENFEAIVAEVRGEDCGA